MSRFIDDSIRLLKAIDNYRTRGAQNDVGSIEALHLNTASDGSVVAEFYVSPPDDYTLTAYLDGNELHVENERGESVFDYADEQGWTKEDVDAMRTVNEDASLSEDLDDYRDWTVTVNFGGYVGGDENYDVWANSEEMAIERALEEAENDLEALNVEQTDDDEWEINIGFAGYIGVENQYTAHGADEDEAIADAIEQAKDDLSAEIAEEDSENLEESWEDDVAMVEEFEAWYDSLSIQEQNAVDDLADEMELPGYDTCTAGELAQLHDAYISGRM